MSWRETAKPIIAEILERTKDSPAKERRIALRDAYPFGERKYWPYKVWLNEIKRQETEMRTRRFIDPNQPNLSFPVVYGAIEIK